MSLTAAVSPLLAPLRGTSWSGSVLATGRFGAYLSVPGAAVDVVPLLGVDAIALPTAVRLGVPFPHEALPLAVGDPVRLDDDGVTVILASHQLLEVQRVCDRVAILNRGKLAAEGRVSDLTASGERLRLSATPLAKIMAVLGERGDVQDDAVMAAIPRAEAPALLRALIEQGVDIDEARWVGADLESVFMTETSSVEGGRP